MNDIENNYAANFKHGQTDELVTVIIPLYNRCKYIEETINSVLNQTYQKVELIVVDDGSTDGSFEIALRLSELNNFVVITHPNRINKGQSAAINLGLQQSKGEYIAILDSDDLFEVDKLERQVEFLVKNLDVGLVYGLGEAIDENGKLLYEIGSDYHLKSNSPSEILLDCYFLLPQNALARRNSYEKVGFFNESYRAAQDHDMLIRLAESARVALLTEKVFKYRRHSESISSNGQMARWNNGFTILEKAAARYPYKRNIIRKRKAVIHYRLGIEYYKIKRLTKAAAHFMLSIAYDPVRALKVLIRLDKSS